MKIIADNVIDETRNVVITIDGYVPLDIKILDALKSSPLYWRTGNGNASLLEFAVLPESGFLSAITLVMIESGSIHKVDCLSVNLSESVEGVPVFNKGLWNESNGNDFSQRFIDNLSVNIKVKITLNSMLLEIDENTQATTWIKCDDNFYLGIDDENNIVNLYLRKLTKSEIDGFFKVVN
ncbi:hypothetical protein [Pantoea sp.]|uniref:hypothetical protein n=1 Tax=Pantoea sp. TaxID=69393 RepID=UPI0028A6D138|nr:hypothetical protein [Pantoea sp.]